MMKRKTLSLLLICGFALCGASVDFEDRSTASFPHIRLELVEQAGTPAMFGVRFVIEPGWHIYGKDPGDVGQPTEVVWSSTGGVEVGDVEWPPAKEFYRDGLVSHVYENEVKLFSAVNRSAAAQSSDKISAEAEVNWVLCRDECIPGHATLRKTFSIANALPAAGVPPASESKTKYFSGRFGITLALAFFGGLLLNLMPCVFPVISLKVLGFLQYADSRKALRHGGVFAFGIILSFWILSGILFTIRAFGTQVGWGFQFQSPLFVVLMGFIIFAVALNFIGVFEVGYGVQKIAGQADCRTGYLGSFFSGILSTLLATPCSAPFMASAITAALTMPPISAFSVFTALGLGMASPYVLLAAFPRFLGFLPAPGPWMVRLKQIMAFPLFASVIWLVWVISLQTGPEGVLRFLSGLLIISIGLWVYGQWSLPGSKVIHRRMAAAVCGVSILMASVAATPLRPLSKDGRSKADIQVPVGVVAERYSKKRLAELRAENKPVLLEFSAAWCLTCQLNHKILFNTDDVVQGMRDKGVVFMEGDWTSNDPEVTRAISALGRDSVPLSVLYAPDQSAPVVFPPVLTAGELMRAIKRIPDRLS